MVGDSWLNNQTRDDYDQAMIGPDNSQWRTKTKRECRRFANAQQW